MNHLIIFGNLGADPEVRFTPAGKKVTTLRVAARARKDETIWWRVTVWGEQFDKMIAFLKKGSSIIVTGEMMKPEIYTDKNGQPQASLNLTAFDLRFGSTGSSANKQEEVSVGSLQEGAVQGHVDHGPQTHSHDDIPF